MPRRNRVPSLKLLAIRQLAWPDALYREKNEAYPSKVGRRRASLNISTLLYGRYSKVNKEKLLKEINAIINGWIRLSDFYHKRLDEMKQIAYLLTFNSITTLDFLHEGFSMRNGVDIHSFAGIIPSTVAPQPVNPYTWKEVATLIKKTGNSTLMRGLFILFGLTTATSELSGYHFMKTLASFPRLTKLVVHGAADDQMMRALGVSCHFLRHLDIRGTKVTESGVLQMIFKSPTDVVKFKSDSKNILPLSFLQPLCQTLQYFDMSTVPKQGELFPQDSLIPQTCSLLVGTHTRFFFDPGGSARFKCEVEGKDMVDLRNKILMALRTRLVDSIYELIVILRRNFQFACNEVELRVTETGEECAILYFENSLLSVLFRIQNLIIISLTSYTASNFDFIPLEGLVNYTPSIQEIKASVKGVLTAERNLPQLKRLTAASIFSKETFKGILLHCKSLEYVEIRELFRTKTTTLNDEDIIATMANGPYPRMEVFRILFQNSITIGGGVKEIVDNCPGLRVIGDFKYWTSLSADIINRFVQNLNTHNFEMMIEHEGMLYHTTTPCKEFYR